MGKPSKSFQVQGHVNHHAADTQCSYFNSEADGMVVVGGGGVRFFCCCSDSPVGSTSM